MAHVSDAYVSAKNAVADHLVLCGWIKDVGWGSGVARKSYQTAVGPKEAIAYLSDFSDCTDYFSLSGDYLSEGRNILSTTRGKIPRTGETDAISSTITSFSTAVDEIVSESYAVRLLKFRSPSARTEQ